MTPRVLSLGCGRAKPRGAIGVDLNPLSAADLRADLGRFPYPFRAEAFDRIELEHVIEHLADFFGVMKEIRALLRPGGTVRIVTPHASDASSFQDPTHVHHLTSRSFDYFWDERLSYFAGGRPLFRPVRRRVVLRSLWRWLGLEALVNRSEAFRHVWEEYLCYVVRGKELEFVLERL